MHMAAAKEVRKRELGVFSKKGGVGVGVGV